MKTDRILLAMAVSAMAALSCAKKHDDPKPSQPAPVVMAQNTDTVPVYPRLGHPKAYEYASINVAGLYLYESFLGVDRSHSPVADMYRFRKMYNPSGTTKLTMLLDTTIRVWWVGGVPQSDFLVFRNDTAHGWMQSMHGYENSTNNAWALYYNDRNHD